MPRLSATPLSEFFVDLIQNINHPRANVIRLDFAEFETDRVNHMLLFVIDLTVEKQCGLREMIGKTLAPVADFPSVNFFFIRRKTAVFDHCLKRTAAAQTVRFIGDATFVDVVPKLPVALVVVDFGKRAIDRNFVKIRAAEPRNLRVEIRMQTTLQQRIVCKINARNDV